MVENWGDTTFKYCANGNYGNFFSQFIKNMDNEFVFVDVGANQGLYTIIAAQNPKCTTCLSFEPVSSTFSLLVENLALNQCQDKVRAVNVGVSGKSGRRQIRVFPGHSGAASLSHHKPSDVVESVDMVDWTKIESMMGEGGEIILKVDTEGSEFDVICEFANTQHFGRIEYVYYEVDERWVDGDSIGDYLKERGFQSFLRVGTGAHFDVLASRKQDLSILHTVI